MNQSGNIAAAVQALWTASTALTTLVPGGLIYGLVKAGTKRPFASMTIALEGEPDYMTGNLYAQDYQLLIDVWSPQEIATAAAIQAALETLLPASTKFALPNNAVVLHVSLAPASLEESAERYKGQFTFIAGAAWQIQLQEFRS